MKIRKVNEKKAEKSVQKKEPIITHLNELRRTLIAIVIVIIVGMSACYALFSKELMGIALNPIRQLMPSMIYTSVSESFATEMKVMLLAGVVGTSPLTLLIVWRFLAPAFFPGEKRSILIYTIIAILLFGSGICFCYFVLLPFTFQFLLNASSVELEAMLTIHNYIAFLCKMLLAFGLIFETPLIIFFLIRFSIIPIKALGKVRKYVLLVCFILAAIITPPDVVSQIFVGVPMYIMYEIGIILGKIYEVRKKRKERKNKA